MSAKNKLQYGGSFKALLYKELLLSRKSIINGFITIPVYLGVCALFLCSFRFGNLGNGSLMSPETAADFKKFIAPMMSILPVLGGAMMPVSFSESAAKDDFTAWRRFRSTIPVTPVKTALAKYTVLAGTFAVGLLFSFGGGALINVLGDGDGFFSVPFIITVNTAVLLISVAYQLLIILLHNNDKAGIGLLVIILAVAFPAIFANTQSGEASADRAAAMSKMITGLSDAAPFMTVLIPVIFAAGFALTAMILGRREK